MFVEGRHKLDSWEDKTDGKKRSKMKVVCEQCQFLGGRDDAAPSQSAPALRPQPTERQLANQDGGGASDIGDVPFLRMEGPCIP